MAIFRLFNRDIGKLGRILHQNPEFGHKRDEIEKKLAKKYISIQGGGWNLEIHPFWW